MSDSPGRIDVPLSLLRCPACRGELQLDGDSLVCSCEARYPVVDGVPVLIDEARSVFSIQSFTRRKETFFVKPSRLRGIIFSVLPELSRNAVAETNFARMSALLLEKTEKPLVLVIGGGILGAGMQ